ncbi:MAG: hypothetical protein IJ860_09665 [Eubacterium sp.]|nr:hypothetical protein [Eubacterium sp.]
MITKDNPTLEQAAGHLHKLTQEEKVRYQCEARERWLLFERSKAESRKELEKDLADKTQELNLKIQQLDQQSQQLDEQSQTISALSDENARLAAEIARLKEQLKDTAS